MIAFFTTKINGSYDKIAYDFSFKDLDGSEIKLSEYKNKVLVVTNVASYCGFTSQYEDLQEIWEKYQKRGLIVIGVPSNSFNQEKETNKVDVKGNEAHNFYKWASKNHGKSAIPKWNFHKIIISKDGKVFDTFSSMTRPTSKKFVKVLEQALNN